MQLLRRKKKTSSLEKENEDLKKENKFLIKQNSKLKGRAIEENKISIFQKEKQKFENDINVTQREKKTIDQKKCKESERNYFEIQKWK